MIVRPRSPNHSCAKGVRISNGVPQAVVSVWDRTTFWSVSTLLIVTAQNAPNMNKAP